jgi:FMN reductase
MGVAVVVGNPKPASRTLDAATKVAARLGGNPPSPVLDLATFGASLLDWADETVTEAVRVVGESDAVVFASPTYKASFTGLIKLFLDRFPAGGLGGVVAFPVMLGGAWRHSLAPEVFLKPVLVELGATCPSAGLFLLDSDYEDPDGLSEWVQRSRRFL